METNALVKTDQQAITETKLLSFLDAMGLAPKLTDKEKITYLEICQIYNLNPFKREVHVVKYKSDGAMSLITGYEVYIKRAERSGLLDGWEVKTEGEVKSKIEDSTLKAIITIHRKDRKFPFVHEVYYSEYVQTTEDWIPDPANPGKNKRSGVKRPTEFWQRPVSQTKKVAMSQGFRLCFSDELGGMPYTKEEMPEVNKVEETSAEVLSTENNTPAEKVTATFTPKVNYKDYQALVDKSDLHTPEEKIQRKGNCETWSDSKLLKAMNKFRDECTEREEIVRKQNENKN